MFCWKQAFFFFSTFVSDSGSLVLEHTKWWPYTWNMKILTIYIGLWSLHCQRGLPFSSSSCWRKSLVWWKHTWSEQVAVGAGVRGAGDTGGQLPVCVFRSNHSLAWHHRGDGHEFEQAPGVGDGQGRLACCSPGDHKVSDMTEWLNQTDPLAIELWVCELLSTYFSQL